MDISNAAVGLIPDIQIARLTSLRRRATRVDHLTFVYSYGRLNSPGGDIAFNPVASQFRILDAEVHQSIERAANVSVPVSLSVLSAAPIRHVRSIPACGTCSSKRV